MVQLQYAAGDGAVCKAAFDAPYENRLAAEGVFAVRKAARAGTVGDQHQLIALHALHQGIEIAAYVESIGDQFAADAVVGQRSTYNAGVAVHERGLRVEQVGHVAHARFDAGLRFIKGRVGMAHGDQGLARHFTYAFHIAGHFRGDGEYVDDIEIFRQEGSVTGADVLAGLGALLCGADERAFRIYAEDLCALPGGRFGFLNAAADLRERSAEFIVGYGHGGGQESGHAVLCHAFGHGFDAVKAAVGCVFAEIAVDMHIDQAGNYVIALRIDDLRTGGDVFGRDDAFDLAGVNDRHIFNQAIGKYDSAVDNCMHIDHL